MKTSTCCSECGQPAGQCYKICPSQDPYAGDQGRENDDYEFGAAYDQWEGHRGEGDDLGFRSDFEDRDMTEADREVAVEKAADAAAEAVAEDDIPFLPSADAVHGPVGPLTRGHGA